MVPMNAFVRVGMTMVPMNAFVHVGMTMVPMNAFVRVGMTVWYQYNVTLNAFVRVGMAVRYHDCMVPMILVSLYGLYSHKSIYLFIILMVYLIGRNYINHII